MTAFPKAAVRERRLSGDLNVRLWPKADIQIPAYPHTCIKVERPRIRDT